MNKIYRVVFLFLPLFLSGCLGTIDVLWQNGYVDEPDSSVIIIGHYSKYRILDIIAEKNGGTTSLSPRRPIRPHINAAAFKVKVGDVIKMVSIKYSASELVEDKYRYAGHVAGIKEPYTLKITKKGIYHLGTIYIKGDKLWVSTKMQPQVLAMAKRHYKNVFNKLKPINFK